jgi:SnoaL-like domain
MSATTDDRLARLLDRQEIIDLTVAYCYILDDRQYEQLREVFTPDAKVDYGSAVCEGVTAIIEKVRGSIHMVDATQHIVSSHRVTLDGDTASSSCQLYSQHVRKGTPEGELYTIGGRYHDELVRTPEGWRIRSRVLERLWSEGAREVVRKD